MSNITRYSEIDADAGMFDSPWGEWVRYIDHEAALKAADAEVDRQKALLLEQTKLNTRVIQERDTLLQEAKIHAQEERLYHELLYAVVCKFPDETRHETALRYIHERESAEVAPAQQEQTK